MQEITFVILIGVGATAFMDVWFVIRSQLFGIPATNWAMVGRWIAHMPQGKLCHNAIADASQVRAENLLGWVVHYLTGIAYAAILIAIWGKT